MRRNGRRFSKYVTRTHWKYGIETRFFRCLLLSLFVDDQQANVDGAIAAGLAGIKYVDVKSLRAGLDDLTLGVEK